MEPQDLPFAAPRRFDCAVALVTGAGRFMDVPRGRSAWSAFAQGASTLDRRYILVNAAARFDAMRPPRRREERAASQPVPPSRRRGLFPASVAAAVLSACCHARVPHKPPSIPPSSIDVFKPFNDPTLLRTWRRPTLVPLTRTRAYVRTDPSCGPGY